MSEIEQAAELYARVRSDLDCVKGTIALVEEIEWLNSSTAKPHLDSAAQGLYVAVARLSQAAETRFGGDAWEAALKEVDLS